MDLTGRVDGEIEAEFYFQVGRRLEAIRKQRRLSRQAVAIEVGVHRNSILRWECGDSKLDIWSLMRLADVLQCHFTAIVPRTSRVWGDLTKMARERDPQPRSLHGVV